MKFQLTAIGDGDRHWIRETAHLAIEEMAKGVPNGTIQHDEGNVIEWHLDVEDETESRWKEKA